MRMLFVTGALVAGVAAQADVLNVTHDPNNGLTAAGASLFMDLTDLGGQGLVIEGFDTFSGAAAGGAWNVEVWVRPGSYVGFTGDSSGWTQWDTINATTGGTATLAPLMLNNQMEISAGQTVGVYLVAQSGGLRYNGTASAPPQTTWSDGSLQMFSDTTRSAFFGGSQFSPRTFAGNIYYTPVPEPATMAVLGLGAAALLRRRRKSS